MRINFYLNHVAKEDGEEAIAIQINKGLKRKKTTIGISISPQQWDEKTSRVKIGAINKKEQSWEFINNQLTMIEGFLLIFTNNNPSSTPEQVIEAYKEKFKSEKIKKVEKEISKPILENENGIRTPPITKTKPQAKDTENMPTKRPSQSKALPVHAYMLDFIQEQSRLKQWEFTTAQKFLALKNNFISFNPKLTFDDFSHDCMDKFINHLRFVQAYRDTTIAKKLGYLKWFFKWAKNKGLSKNNDFEAYAIRLKNVKKKVVFLDWNELMQLYHYEPPIEKKYLERVKDVFLFLCFTGLRHSDAYNLKRHNIHENHISITSIKDIDTLKIELNDYSKNILDKYKSVVFDDNKALPVISNQKMNDYLKELCKLAGLDSLITDTYFKMGQRCEDVYKKHEVIGTHCGRRTFICNALTLGVPIHVVMKWTGHSDYKAMKPYIDVADSEKEKAMTVFNIKPKGLRR